MFLYVAKDSAEVIKWKDPDMRRYSGYLGRAQSKHWEEVTGTGPDRVREGDVTAAMEAEIRIICSIRQGR